MSRSALLLLSLSLVQAAGGMFASRAVGRAMRRASLEAAGQIPASGAHCSIGGAIIKRRTTAPSTAPFLSPAHQIPLSRGFSTTAMASPQNFSAMALPKFFGDGIPAKKAQGIKAIMTVTPGAAARIAELRARHAESHGIRVSLRQRGCSGMTYVMDFQKTEPAKFDEVVTFTNEDGTEGKLFY